MVFNLRVLLCAGFLLCDVIVKGQDVLPELRRDFQGASVRTKGNELIVSTGTVERTWRWTGKGLVTTGFRNSKTGKQWAELKPQFSADWAYYGLIDETEATLVSLTAQRSDDEGFTADHLEVIAEVRYPSVASAVKYQIWAYPHASGIFTRVWFKGNAKANYRDISSGARNDVSIRQISGKNQKPYLNITAPKWMLSYAADPKSIQYHITGIDRQKDYVLGLSWWSFDKKKRVQKVRVSSVDGESEEQLIGNTGISFEPDSMSVKVPVSRVANDNSFRVFIDNAGGENAIVSEVWLYEKTDSAPPVKNGVPERILELNRLAPEGYKLAAYFDSGEAQDAEKFKPTGRIDYIPVALTNKNRRYIGYYNDTQHRNTPGTPIYREELKTGLRGEESINWANIISIEDGNEGLIMVKESHKCVNQYGTDTGDFLTSGKGIENTGTSLYPDDIDAREYKWAWASWTIAYEGNDDYRQLAVKEFDRLRFPTNIQRDMYTLVCSWGNSKNGRDGRNYATEREVLAEMKAADSLGIDLLLIDDGWQVSLDSKGAAPEADNGWKPHPEAYPQGWKNVAALKQNLGIALGLWGIAQNTTVDEMVWNWQRIRMKQFKLDFANFRDHNALDGVIKKARDFMIRTNHESIISWDLTENAPRYGYYWAREYGDLHFMNRKDHTPANAIYVPSLCLRDYWHLSGYNNLNKFQLTVQNPEITDKELSDAWKYSAQYCVATTLMGVPEFMALPRFFSDKAKSEIKELLKIYKRYRRDIWESYQFPVGEQPNNASFTGFQSFHPGKDKGYFMLYRELNALENRKDIQVRFLEGKKIQLTDLRTGQTWSAHVSAEGLLPIEILKPADFRFIQYQVLD